MLFVKIRFGGNIGRIKSLYVHFTFSSSPVGQAQQVSFGKIPVIIRCPIIIRICRFIAICCPRPVTPVARIDNRLLTCREFRVGTPRIWICTSEPFFMITLVYRISDPHGIVSICVVTCRIVAHMLLACQCFCEMCNVFIIVICLNGFRRFCTQVIDPGKIEYLLCRLITCHQFDIIHPNIVLIGYKHNG